MNARNASSYLILRVIISALFYWAATALASFAHAQMTDTSELSDPEPVIAIDTAQASDAAIKDRIEGILAELDGLSEITVSVSEGVVTLSGEAPSSVIAEKALRIAIRPVGVVTVEDEIERTLKVEQNIAPMLAEYQEKLNRVVRALPLMGVALLIIILFSLLGGFMSRRKHLWRRMTKSPFLAEILSQAVRIALFVIGVVLALDLIGASTLLTTILGGAGVIGIAIGFAIRDTMENYISSVMLSIRQPFRAKDHVIINDKEGIVVRLTSRATILMTLDGNHLRIPNSEVFKGTILNYSTNPDRRFSFVLGVDAEDDPIEAMRIGLDAMRAHDFVLTEPASSATITEVGDSNIVIKFNGWVNQTQTNFGKARSLAIRSVKSVLEDQGFTLPEPIYRVRFDPRIHDAMENVMDRVTENSASKSGKAKAATRVTKNKTPKSNIALPPVQTTEAEILDVKPDKDLHEKVEAEIQSSDNNDLLDQNQPQE